MKKKVKFSTYSTIITVIILAALIGILCWQAHENVEWAIWVLFGVIVFFCSMALYYAPQSVSVDDRYLSINRSIRTKSIPLSEIKSVELLSPTMSEKRICGSGGFFGYWGHFTEPSIGKYFAYYGKASDCFLITLTNNKKYLLGCQNAPEIITYITSRLK